MTITRRIQTVISIPGVAPFESNILLREMETRPDWRVPASGDYVYVLRDLWPQVEGSAESWPQWARDSYLKPWGDPCGNDAAGGDHHLFAVTTGTNEQCGVSHNKLHMAWTDGFAKLGDPNYTGYVTQTATATHGWVNWVNVNGYYPDQGQRGPWCWCPFGYADVVDGGGLPYNRHVSWFGVWQRMTYADYLIATGGAAPPEIPPESGAVPEAAVRLALELSTRVVKMTTADNAVTYHYMSEATIVAKAVAIERGLTEAYDE